MITQNELLNICHKLAFPEEACEYFSQAYSGLLKADGCYEKLMMAEDAMINCGGDFEKVVPFLDSALETCGLTRRTLDMIFRIITVPDVVKLYEAKEVPENIIWDTLADITYELKECHRVFGEWGTFVLWFYPRLFAVNLFRLGRLEFELHDSDDLIDCHISSYGRLDMEAVMESLKDAYKFFGYEKGKDIMKITCDSWILYPAMKEIYPEDSNLRRFFDLFEIVESKETNEDMWYIFWKPVDTPVDELPEETSLQRGAKAWLKSGKSLGIGIGRFDFDGENVRRAAFD